MKRVCHVIAVGALLATGVANLAAQKAPAAPITVADATALPVEKSANPEANGLLTLGTRLSATGDYATAEIAYRQILNRGDFAISDQKTALLGLAHMFRRAGALTKAVAIYEKFLQEFPDDSRAPDAYLDLGRTLRDVGAYKLALTRFYSVINTTLQLNAQEFEHYSLLAKTAQFEIAQTYYESGDYSEAGKFFTRVRLLDLAPVDRARAHFMAGCAEERAGELTSAVTTLRGFLDQWPKDENVPEARYVLATTLDALKRPQDALAVTLELLNAEHSQNTKDVRRWTYWQRRTGNQLANKFFQNGDTLDALRIYLCLVDLSPEPSWHLPVVYQTALCYERLYQVPNARTAYAAVIDGATAKPDAPAPSADMVELAGMAKWRMDQLGWRDDLNHRLTSVLAPGSMDSTRPIKAGSPVPSAVTPTAASLSPSGRPAVTPSFPPPLSPPPPTS
jgi:tetratricopeptide (TPR) repeat protein